jgi:hypothetical protein
MSTRRERETHFAIVDTNYTSNHFWDDDHVAQVCLHNRRFLVGRGLFLRFSQFLDKTHWFALDTTLEPAAYTGVDKLWRIILWLPVRDNIHKHTSMNCKVQMA